MPSTSRQSTANRPVDSDVHWSYQNIRDEQGFLEPTYVDPIPNSVYANDDDAETGTYENVFPTKEVQHDSDSCNYENVKNDSEEDSESEYVNAPRGNNSGSE